MSRPADAGVRYHNPLTFAERRALIALSLVPGVGPDRIKALVEKFSCAQDALSASQTALAHLPGIGTQTALNIVRFDEHDAVDRQIEWAEKVDAEMVTWWDERYPKLLHETYGAPAFLWVRGHIRTGSAPDRCIAIVGTRRPTNYGRRVAYEFASVLARLGFVIVSGLAYGIDAAAHSAALEADGRTIAVLGSGVDRIYPSRNTRLAHSLLERGAIISEFPMREKPDAPNFPRRNRIISGMSIGTLVIEAYEEGGALITAKLAIEQDRYVWSVPGSIHSKASRGANGLIREGPASLVQRVEDILDDLGLGDHALQPTVDVPPLELDGLPREEQILCRVLTSEPEHIDKICAMSGLDPATALVYLLNLELKGIVRQLAGKQFFLTAALSKSA